MFALVGTGESSSALTDPWEERDSLPKWLSNHLDVSNFLASSSSSKSNGFLVNTSLRAGKFSPGKPGRANEFVFPKVLFIYLSKKKKRRYWNACGNEWFAWPWATAVSNLLFVLPRSSPRRSAFHGRSFRHPRYNRPRPRPSVLRTSASSPSFSPTRRRRSRRSPPLPHPAPRRR